MTKMGVNIDVETKPKVVEKEKEKKKKPEADKPMQALLEVNIQLLLCIKNLPFYHRLYARKSSEKNIFRKKRMKKLIFSERRGLVSDLWIIECKIILLMIFAESPVATNVAENEIKVKSEEPQPTLVVTQVMPSTNEIKPTNKIITKDNDTHVPLSPTITKHGSDEREVPTNSNQNTTEAGASTETHNTHQPHQCTKCNHICNNCNYSNTSNNNNNNNATNNNNNNNTEGNEYADDCEDEGSFERTIDCPTPTEEKVHNRGFLSLSSSNISL
jgi:hypothetical protein